MNKLNFYLLFFLILLISIFTRTYKLSTNPPSLYSDEIDAAYHALVFNQCQTDYNGKKFPIHFKSESDYQSPGTIYSIAFLQKFFKTNDFTVRLPSSIYGILTCFSFFLLGSILLNKKLGFIMFFVSAINPWLIHYSRINFGVSGMLFSTLLSLFLWKKYDSSHKLVYFVLSLISLIVSSYFYSTAKLFIVFIGLLFLILSYKQLKQISFYKLFIGLFFVLLISFPMIFSTLKGESGYRFSYINIFSDPTVKSQVDYYRYLDIKTDNLQIGTKTPLFSKFFHNKYQYIFDKFIKNYFSSFSTDFLFNKGDSNIRHGFNNYGYLYYVEIIFLLIGSSYYLKRYKTKTNIVLLFLLIISPIPYSLTRDSLGPHGTRLILMVIPLIFLISFGIYSICISRFTIIKIILLILYVFSFISFYYFYTFDYPHISAGNWGSGTKKTIQKITEISQDYDKIFYSDKYQSSLFYYLYYTKTIPDCNIYIKLSQENFDFFNGTSLDQKYYFGNLNWNQILENKTDNILFIVPEYEFETVIKKIDIKNINIIYNQQNKYETEPKFVFFTI